MRIPGISLKGQTAIVTGARRGIGKDTALVLAEAGADVAICDLVSETGELDAVAAEIKSMGRKAISMKANAGSQDDMEKFVQSVIKEFKTIDILVNNAGIGSGLGPPEPERFGSQRERMMERMAHLLENPHISLWEEQDWDKVMSTNLKSILISAKAVSPVMVKNRKGAIVSVASVMAYSKGISALSAYSVSKRGIVMLTEALAADLGKFGIRVNAIAPGGIETEMMRYVWAVPEALNRLESKMLLGGKLLKPLHCAHLILFLVCDLSAYITGQTIVIDGGLTIAPDRPVN